MLGFVPFLNFVVKQSSLCKAMRWAWRSARGSIVQRALRRSARPPIPFTSNTKKRGQTTPLFKNCRPNLGAVTVHHPPAMNGYCDASNMLPVLALEKLSVTCSVRPDAVAIFDIARAAISRRSGVSAAA